VLSTHPALRAIAIVPRPDAELGEIGVAVVVPRDQARVPTLEDLRAFAGANVAAFKLPEALVVRSELPLTAAEKIDRRALVAELNDLVT
jgi:acyl-CoA synthetase (AMP-forming)/AMP-acid ligase II